jgi:isochorismate synthase
MKVLPNRAQLFIGCGITKDSNPEDEYMETVNKSMTMKKILS